MSTMNRLTSSLLIVAALAILLACWAPFAAQQAGPRPPSNAACNRWGSPDLYPEAEIELFSGEPCSPGCWQGLEPGVSTKEEAVALLQTASFVESFEDGQLPYCTPTLDDLGHSIMWDSYSYPHMGHISFNQEIVCEVTIYVEFPLTVEDVIASLGEPDGYYNFELLEPHGESSGCYAPLLIWHNAGIIVSPYDRYARGPLDLRDQVRNVEYRPPADSIYDFLSVRRGSAIHDWTSANDYIVP